MATAIRYCKVCGNAYEYCRTLKPGDMFRWQDVACSPEHGREYFRQIAESRGEITAEAKEPESVDIPKRTEAPKAAKPVKYVPPEVKADNDETEDWNDDFEYEDER